MAKLFFIIVSIIFFHNTLYCSNNADLLIQKHLDKPNDNVSQENYYLFKEKGFNFREDTFVEEYESQIKKNKIKDIYKISAYLDIEHGTSLKDAFGIYGDGNLKQITTRFNVGLKRNIFSLGTFAVSADIRSIRQNITYNDPIIDEDVELYECYYERNRPNWDIKIGKQKILWGHSDMLYHAVDLFPKINVFPVWKHIDRYEPVWGIVMKHGFNMFDLETILIPKFQCNRQAPGDSIWKNEQNSYLDMLRLKNTHIEHESYTFPNDGSYGFRLITRKNDTHIECGYLSYLLLDPVIFKDDLIQQGNNILPQTVVLKHPRNMSLFLTADKKLSETIHGYFETSYQFNGYFEKQMGSVNDFNTVDDSVESAHSWKTAGGFSKVFNTLLNCKIQLFTEYIFNKHDIEKSSYIGGLSYDIYGSFLSEKLTYHLEGIRYSYQQMFFNPYLQYKCNQKYYMDFGYYLFSGSNAHEPFGQYQNNDQIYCGFRYSL